MGFPSDVAPLGSEQDRLESARVEMAKPFVLPCEYWIHIKPTAQLSSKENKIHAENNNHTE